MQRSAPTWHIETKVEQMSITKKGSSPRRGARLLLALPLAIAALLVSGCVPETPAGPSPTTVPGTYREGRCVGTEGVTVIVDFAAFQDRTVIRCVFGAPASGKDALEKAGFTHDPGAFPGSVCQLDGLPAQGHPYCWTTGGYWSYWKATAAGQPWKYSEWGFTAGPAPQPGHVEGWRFGLFADSTHGLAPRVGTGA